MGQQGYANEKYFERIDFLDWRLREGVSASEGIKAWLKGLTIADCLTAIQTIYLDTIRAAIGDTKFNDKLGSADPNKKIPENQRLRISGSSANQASDVNFVTETDAAKKGDLGEQGKRPNLKVGEWYYFANHPKYLLKHPGGDWTGENAIYMGENEKGEQIWSGLGESRVTEGKMLTELTNAYNEPRTGLDYAEIERLREVYIKNGANPRFVDVVFDSEQEATVEGVGLGDTFPDQIKLTDILTAAPYKHPIDGIERQGGFLMKAGKKLELDKIKRL